MAAVIVIPLLGLVVLMMAWQLRRGRDMVAAWARTEGFVLESASRCWFWRGPYWLRSNEGHAVYRVTVRDGSGRRRTGYVRCGGWFLGLFSDRVDARLDP